MCRWVMILSLFGLVLPGFAHAAEPRVAFAITEPGWLQFTVTQDGKPVPEALVKVFDDQGREHAEGETGSQGRSQFPLPRSGGMTLEFKIGQRTADPVVLLSTPTGVEPEQVLLSFGLRPCCRVISRGGSLRPEAELTPAPSVPSSRVLPITAVAVCFMGGLSLLYLALRPSGRNPT